MHVGLGDHRVAAPDHLVEGAADPPRFRGLRLDGQRVVGIGRRPVRDVQRAMTVKKPAAISPL
jgi:hypothetical protein